MPLPPLPLPPPLCCCCCGGGYGYTLTAADAAAFSCAFRFVGLWVAILSTLGSLIFQPDGMKLHLSNVTNATFYRPSIQRLRANWYPAFTDDVDVNLILALIFSSTCGVMEGAK